MFEMTFDEAAIEELRLLRTADQVRVLDEIEEALTRDALIPSKRRKRLDGLVPEFEHEPPVWELRVGNYRVFYDVDAKERVVRIRAIRFKGRKTTKEIT